VSLTENLIALYAGITVINVLLSGALWWTQREAPYRRLFFVWAATLLAGGIQAPFQQGALAISLSFSLTFAVNLALAALVSGLVSLSVPWRSYCVGIGLGVSASVAADFLGGPFWMVALPVAAFVALPLAHTSVRIAMLKWSELTAFGKGLVATCMAFCAHNLDFAFLRDEPDFAPLGFTIAILIEFALSITGIATVLERVIIERAFVQRTSDIKDRFFANISHELRTPLTVVLAAIEDLLQRVPDEAVREQLSIMRRNAIRLLRLIDDLLDLTRLDAGGLRLNIAPVVMRSLVTNVFETQQPLARARSLNLVLRSPDAPEIKGLYGDAHRLEMVLTNLVGNAIKYTQSGTITVSIEEDGDGVRVHVEDTGPGIARDALPRIFERFFQAEGKERRHAGGVGLGLSLAKELAELHEGRITVKSEVGVGSVFTLWLPKGTDHFRPEVIERRTRFDPNNPRRRGEDGAILDASQPAPAPPFSQPRTTDDLLPMGKKARVLVVEDQDDLRRMIRELLSQLHEVLEAKDGEEGIAMVRAERPDLVVSDVMMPRLAGTELCRMIKRDPALRATPVILLTARIGSEATLDAYAHGANDFVAKPFHPQVLLARVHAQLKLRSLGVQLASQEKMAAVGLLAAGVAHEVRNPLNFIINAAEALRELPLESEDKQLLEVVSDGARRIDEIVLALQAHTRPSESTAASVPCKPIEGLKSAVSLLRHRMKDVTVHQRFESDRESEAASGEVNQIFLNLVDNAVRAGAKNIWLSVEQKGSELVVRVDDDGPGIPTELLDRIFDAFFTTRAPGEGTGLGLYLARRIAEQNGGGLVALQRAEGGARFELRLPAKS
jgi:signal transduction histidine kinase